MKNEGFNINRPPADFKLPASPPPSPPKPQAGQLQGAPAAYLRASDLDRLHQPHVAGCAASLNKDARAGFVPIYTDAPSDAQSLEDENERLRALLAQKLVDSTMLTGLVPDASGINIGIQGGACGLLADAFGEQLFESGAENYIEAFFTSRKYRDLGQIIVTVRRETGKTPHALRQEAEGAAKRMVSLLAEIRNGMSANWTPKSGKALLCRTTLMTRIDAELSGGGEA